MKTAEGQLKYLAAFPIRVLLRDILLADVLSSPDTGVSQLVIECRDREFVEVIRCSLQLDKIDIVMNEQVAVDTSLLDSGCPLIP